MAKVLLLEPKIQLMDEPTKGFDAEFKQVFAAILRRFFSGNSLYTSTANRMARHVLPEAITAADLIIALGGTASPSPSALSGVLTWHNDGKPRPLKSTLVMVGDSTARTRWLTRPRIVATVIAGVLFVARCLLIDGGELCVRIPGSGGVRPGLLVLLWLGEWSGARLKAQLHTAQAGEVGGNPALTRNGGSHGATSPEP